MLSLNLRENLRLHQNNHKAEDQTTTENSTDQRINPFQDNHQNKVKLESNTALRFCIWEDVPQFVNI